MGSSEVGGVSADVMLSVAEASACKVVIVSVAPFEILHYVQDDKVPYSN